LLRVGNLSDLLILLHLLPIAAKLLYVKRKWLYHSVSFHILFHIIVFLWIVVWSGLNGYTHFQHMYIVVSECIWMLCGPDTSPAYLFFCSRKMLLTSSVTRWQWKHRHKNERRLCTDYLTRSCQQFYWTFQTSGALLKLTWTAFFQCCSSSV
jgi:hypothetical protein